MQYENGGWMVGQQMSREENLEQLIMIEGCDVARLPLISSDEEEG